MHNQTLVVILRLMGSFSLLALIFVFVPYSWMNSIHQLLGMGELSPDPIVGYLARSTSAFYALLGGLIWVVSFDPRRYKLVLTYLGAAFVVFGLILTFVDWLEGLPLMWKVWEGPFVTIVGITIFSLSRRVGNNQ